MSAQQVTATGQMRINLPGVIKMLGESLYSDPSVAIRELIQNANDTCIVRQAKDPHAPQPEIKIDFNAWEHTLIVEDNGAGLTAEEVKEFLTVIGRSHTDEVRRWLEEEGQLPLAERLIGRFGLGLLSAFMIADRIEFDTLSYQEGAEPNLVGLRGWSGIPDRARHKRPARHPGNHQGGPPTHRSPQRRETDGTDPPVRRPAERPHLPGLQSHAGQYDECSLASRLGGRGGAGS